MSLKGFFRPVRLRHRTVEGRLVQALERNNIDCVVDVGANEGQTGKALIRGGFKGRIVSFEPVAAAHRDLERAASRAPQWIVAPPMALGERNGDIAVNVSLTHNWSSIKRVHEDTVRLKPKARVVAREQVPLRRLDAVLDEFVAPTERLFVKIDTQGYEGEILRGAAGIVDRIQGFQLELCLTRLYEGEELYRSFLDWMEAHDFELWTVEGASYSVDLGRQTHFDAVFFRRQ